MAFKTKVEKPAEINIFSQGNILESLNEKIIAMVLNPGAKDTFSGMGIIKLTDNLL